MFRLVEASVIPGGQAHTLAVQVTLMQSGGCAHFLPVVQPVHFGHDSPTGHVPEFPQSVSDSVPFFTPSSHVGAWHVQPLGPASAALHAPPCVPIPHSPLTQSW